MTERDGRDRLAVNPHFRSRICIVLAVILIISLSWLAAAPRAEEAQNAPRPNHIKKLYIGSFGDKPGMAAIRSKLIRRLERQRLVELVTDPNAADAVLTGSGQIWVIGYYSTNPKPSPWNRQALYDGYLTGEIRDRNNELIWSYRAKPGKWRWGDITQELANQVANKLFEVLKPRRGVP